MNDVVPLSDARRLIAIAKGGRALTVALAALAVLLAALFVLFSRHPGTHTIVPLPANADTVIVLDLSASISTDTYSRIGGTLQSLADSGRRFGLIVFSDDAYEAMPPGTPSADLQPIVRYFTLPPPKAPGFEPIFPRNPWSHAFTAGTRISAGLALAHRLALETSQPATVVLVSDLSDSPTDLTQLTTVLLTYRRDNIPMRIVGLNAGPADTQIFEQLLPRGTAIVNAPTLEQAAPHQQTPFPWRLVDLVAAASVALGLVLLRRQRLDWRAA
jgi:hypothetical protein